LDHSSSPIRHAQLAHFFRTIDFNRRDDLIAWPSDPTFASATDATVLKPLYMLRHAVRMGRLYATWGERGDRRTVFGPYPIVPFMDLTPQNLSRVSPRRTRKPGALSCYAITFPRDRAMDVGAKSIVVGPRVCDCRGSRDCGDQRLLHPAFLDPSEQFRYVEFEKGGEIDWVHHNEWRWPYTGQQWRRAGFDWPPTSLDIGGLDIDDRLLSAAGIVVAKQSEVRLLKHDILTKIDRGDLPIDHYKYVVPYSEFGGMLNDADGGVAFWRAAEAYKLDFSEYLGLSAKSARGLTRDFDSLTQAVAESGPRPEGGEKGGCWLWLLDPFHPMTRGLIKSGAAKVNKSGKYLVRIVSWQATA
jgi:hypothetical protein